MSKESFVYLWYDAPNDMYYLGKHKGSPKDKYTHSSTIWESFTKDNIPEGVTREILAYGTDEEMCILEHELLVKAKNGGDWDRYYNNSLGDPRYVDQWGDNNSQWKGGVWANDPVAYTKAYEQTPKRKAYEKKRNATPERKAYHKEYQSTPEYKALRRKRQQTPECKAYHKAWYAKKKAEAQS
jgi:hypothetical protein